MSVGDIIFAVEKLSPQAPPSKLPCDPNSNIAPPSPLAYMQLHSQFFRQPWELQDLIYHHYLSSETGLEYDSDKNRLTTADGEGIDLSLEYTCRVPAAELQGLALRLNKVTFRIAYTDTSRRKPLWFRHALQKLNWNKIALLERAAHICLTEEKEKRTNLVYLQFVPPLRGMRLMSEVESEGSKDHT